MLYNTGKVLYKLKTLLPQNFVYSNSFQIFLVVAYFDVESQT